MKNKILGGLALFFLVIQFIQPTKNLSDDNTYHIKHKYNIPTEVAQLLKVACDDCHSNKTEYPWYAQVQPVAWWLNHHVTDGKKHLNFSNFTSRPIAVQNHKLEETIEMIEHNEMPLSSYTWLGLHPQAKLSQAQRQTLISWAKAQMDTLKANYPPDSLVLKRKK